MPNKTLNYDKYCVHTHLNYVYLDIKQSGIEAAYKSWVLQVRVEEFLSTDSDLIKFVL